MVRKAKDEHGAQDPGADEETVTRTRLAVLRLARRLRQQTVPGITPSQQSALAAVEQRGPLTLGELAAYENVRPPSITRIVAALEAEAWVERIADPSDRRVTTVQITTRGRRELRRIREERNAWLAARLAVLDADERARLDAALPALERLVDTPTDEVTRTDEATRGDPGGAAR